MNVEIGNQGYVVDAVDQTVNIPHQTTLVLVPDNVRPGSHLFTVLSDYGLPVIAVPSQQLRDLEGRTVKIYSQDNSLNIEIIE